jgi:hypothetical protein
MRNGNDKTALKEGSGKAGYTMLFVSSSSGRMEDVMRVSCIVFGEERANLNISITYNFGSSTGTFP